MTKRDKAIYYGCKFIGQPYIWRGDDPVGGFDCSGWMSEICRALGIISVKARYSAAGLFEYLTKMKKGKIINEQCRGCLVFWRNDKKEIKHVELALDEESSIGAFGGDSTTDSLEDASAQNAFVGIRPTRRWASGDLIYMDVFEDQ